MTIILETEEGKLNALYYATASIKGVTVVRTLGELLEVWRKNSAITKRVILAQAFFADSNRQIGWTGIKQFIDNNFHSGVDGFKRALEDDGIKARHSNYSGACVMDNHVLSPRGQLFMGLYVLLVCARKNIPCYFFLEDFSSNLPAFPFFEIMNIFGGPFDAKRTAECVKAINDGKIFQAGRIFFGRKSTYNWSQVFEGIQGLELERSRR